MPTDRVLIEIVTAANMAGIKEAQAGMLGMNASTLALAAGLGILVMGGKSAIEISEKHQAAELGLAQAYKATGTNLKTYQGYIDNFIKSNRSYISDQSQVIDGFAKLTRSGLNQTEVQKDMNRALDLAALKHITLEEAVTLLDAAEHGRLKGLIDLGITSAKYTDANGNMIPSMHNVATAMAEIDAKTAHGRDTVTENEKAWNHLTNDWQDMANRGGPALEGAIRGVENKVADLYDWFDKIGKDDKLWATINDRLVAMAGWIKQYILDPLGIAQGAANSLPTSKADSANAAATRAGVPGGYRVPGTGAPYGFNPNDGYAYASPGYGPGQTRPDVIGKRAGGGPVEAGQMYTVGERGPETLLMGGRGGTVIPNSGGGIQIHIHGGLYADGPGLDRLSNEIARRLSFVTGR